MRRTRSFRSSRPRRKRVWVSHNEQIPSGTSAGFDCLADFRTRTGITAGPMGITIARIRGQVQFLVASPVTLDEGSGVYVGILKESRLETTLTIDKPLTNPYLDYMYRTWVPASHYNPTNSTVANSYIWSHEFDVKSMRKIDEVDETLWLTYEASGGITVKAFYNLQILALMP
jgi:hypothetical protein